MSWSEERMQKYSLMLASEMVDFAFVNVPFYHEHFKTAGYEEEELKLVGF